VRPLLARRALPIAVTAAALLGCGTPKKPGPDAGARQLVEELRAAAEDRDANAVAVRLTDDFKGAGGMDRAEALVTLKKYFAAYERLRVSVYDVEITRESSRIANVKCRVEVTGSARRVAGLDALLPPSAVIRFEMRAIWPSNPDWLVQSADWKVLEGSPAP
jgi:hypothetical protein